MTIIIILIFVCVTMLWLNVTATITIARDSFSDPVQRRMQLILVWILSLVGASVVLAVHREAEKPSRRYIARLDPEDEITGSDIVGTVGDGGGSD